MEIEKSAAPNHKIYPRCEKEDDADAIGKACLDTIPTFVDYPFKFPPLKSNEVRAQILFTGICHSDIHFVKGDWFKPKFPVVPGHEIVARVIEVGSDVGSLKVGDRVGWGYIRDFCGECERCSRGSDHLCIGETEGPKELYDPYFGGFATHIQAPAKSCVQIPEKLPDDKTPPLLCAGITVYAALKKHGYPGCNVGILGIGGLGHLAVKFAKAMGFNVTAFTSKVDTKEEEIKKMGADVVASSDIGDLCGFLGSQDLVLNTIYSRDKDFFSMMVQLLRPGGVLCFLALPRQGEPLNLEINDIVTAEITIAGVHMGSKKMMQEMLEFAAEHQILPEIELFQWEEFSVGIEKCSSGTAKYRCVVDCNKYSQKKSLK